MNRKKSLLITVIVVILSSLLCLGLYRFDNKYTRADIQPINGVLFYSEVTDYCYLTRQWIIYPDTLLAPDDVEGYSGYRYYGDIGGTKKQEQNSMTYRLTLILPDEPQEYALELPEVFSSYKFYINDTLQLQLGDPAPESYLEGISSRIITFSASGETELLLAVSDFSGINQGMTYPPAFGQVDAVLAAREGKMLLHWGLVLLALLGALLSITFGIRENLKKGALSCMLCLTLTIITGYPLYHGLFITKVQPWYTLEPLCYYAILLLALLLQCTLYELKPRRQFLLVLPCIVGLTFTLVRFGCSSILPDSAAQVFSWVSTGLKYYTAVCLLGLSFWALWNGKSRSTLPLCGATTLALFLIWDRLLPLYEPIYGGWLGEIGSILLVIFLSSAIWLDAIDAYRFRLTYESSLHQMEQRLTLQKEHYSQLSHQIQLAREASHDLRHHMRTMHSFAEQEDWVQLKHYLEQYTPHAKKREIVLYSENPTVDAILKYYAAAAQELNATYDVCMAISSNLPFPDAELCILLGNLLENAIEAIAIQKDGNRSIYLRGSAADGRLGIVLDNTFDGKLRLKNGVYLSTKHPGTGLGLSSITTIAEKYGGLTDFVAEDHVFHASILIPLVEKK